MSDRSLVTPPLILSVVSTAVKTNIYSRLGSHK